MIGSPPPANDGALQLEWWRKSGRNQQGRSRAVEKPDHSSAFIDTAGQDFHGFAGRHGGRRQDKNVRRLQYATIRVLAVSTD